MGEVATTLVLLSCWFFPGKNYCLLSLTSKQNMKTSTISRSTSIFFGLITSWILCRFFRCKASRRCRSFRGPFPATAALDALGANSWAATPSWHLDRYIATAESRWWKPQSKILVDSKVVYFGINWVIQRFYLSKSLINLDGFTWICCKVLELIRRCNSLMVLLMLGEHGWRSS